MESYSFANDFNQDNGLSYPHDLILDSEQQKKSLGAVVEILKQDFNQLRGQIFTSDVTQAKTYDFKVEESRRILAGEPTEGNRIAQEAVEIFNTTPQLHAQHILDTYQATKNLALDIDIIRLRVSRQLPIAQTLGEMLQIRNEALEQLNQFRTTKELT